jgi:hypothetical protein
MLKVITFTCTAGRPDPVVPFADGFAGVPPPQAEATMSQTVSVRSGDGAWHTGPPANELPGSRRAALATSQGDAARLVVRFLA